MRDRALKICIVTPAPPRSRKGNRITALRWARILRQLGHRVDVLEEYQYQPYDLMVALHARKSHPSIVRYRETLFPKPLILALTGTDLYEDIHTDESARQSLEIADRLIVLQEKGVEELPQHLRSKTRVIYQSIATPRNLPSPQKDIFDVCVIGHLREVKDPFRAAHAARLLPETSKIRVLQIGGALGDDMEQLARHEAATNPRYQWLGEMPRWRTLRMLARCRLLVLTSKMEGGANVVGEALVCGRPVLSSRISGSIGLLGADYPGYFPYGDTEALAHLMGRAESDAEFYRGISDWCAQRKKMFEPANEKRCWRTLIQELAVNQ